MNETIAPVAGEEETVTTFAAVDVLSKQLERYRQVNAEVAALEDKLAKLEVDEGEVLNDVGADEDTQVKRLADVRIRKDVQARRTSHKRLEVSRMLSELEEVYPAAEMEVSAAQTLELSRRKEILNERAVKVLGLTDDDWEAKNFVLRAVGGSPHLRVLRACGPNANAHLVSIEQRANDLLAQVDKLQAELGKSI